MKYLLGNAVIVMTTLMPVAASAQLMSPLNDTLLLSGTIGAGLGGAVGPKFAPNGLGDESSAIGAIAGGLAGAAYGNSRSQRVAERSLTSRTTPYALRRSSHSVSRSHKSYYGGGSAAYNYNPSNTPKMNYTQGAVPTPPTFHRIKPAVRKPAPSVATYTPSPRIIVQKDIIRKERIIIPAQCPVGTLLQSDGRCMELPKTVYAPPPKVIASSCPADTLDQGNGTCLEPAKKVIKPAPIVIPSHCPSGTLDQGDGTCLERAKTIIGQAPIIIPAKCPTGTTDSGDGTCLAPAKKVINQTPIIIPATCPMGTRDKGNGTCIAPPKKVIHQMPIIVPAACPEGTLSQGNGICLKPAKTIIEPAPVIIPSSCPADTIDQGNGTCKETAKTVISQAPIIQPASCPTGTTRQSDGICLAAAKIAETVAPSPPVMPSAPTPAYVPIVMPESVTLPSCDTDNSKRYDEDGETLNSDALAGAYDPIDIKCKM